MTSDEVKIKVVVRTRPLLPKEKLVGEQNCIKVASRKQLIIGKNRTFFFDNVFSPKSSQNEVYQHSVQPLLSRCLEGFNVTVLSYGPTGSGKTYTIGGHMLSQTEDKRGQIPRAAQELFDRIKRNESDKICTVKVSYIEIFKEELRDLLDADNGYQKEIFLREDEKGTTCVTGCLEVQCQTAEDILTCLEQGESARQFGATPLNEKSSRSHCIFTLTIYQTWNSDKEIEDNEATDEETVQHNIISKFHFVDLAGSERSHRIQTSAERLKESIHINCGLLALGNVISALTDTKRKISHVPYRDSKITRILKDSLGGNAQTVMICCISSSAITLDESITALKYASRAKNIKNRPIINKDAQTVKIEEMENEIKALKEELFTFKKQNSAIGNVSSICVSEPVNDNQKLMCVQSEISKYKNLNDKAFHILYEANRKGNFNELSIEDWLNLYNETSDVNTPVDLVLMESLKSKITKLELDLKRDEEVFASKATELKTLQNRISELENINATLEDDKCELQLRLKQEEELLIAKQLQIINFELDTNVLTKTVENSKSSKFFENSLEIHQVNCKDSSTNKSIISQRAQSVPAHMIGHRSQEIITGDGKRVIYTSPALLMDRVMQGFRVRSQLLVSRIEEEDEVIQPQFDEFNSNEDIKSNKYFERSQKSRSTYRVIKPKNRKRINERPSKIPTKKIETDANSNDNNQLSDELKRIRQLSETRKQRILATENDVRLSNKRLQEIASTIDLKEELINIIKTTHADSKEVTRLYQAKNTASLNDREIALNEAKSLEQQLKELEKGKDSKQKLENISNMRRKLKIVLQKIDLINEKQKDYQNVANISLNNEKKMLKLETVVSRLKSEHLLLEKKLQEEKKLKEKLQEEIVADQVKMKQLEMLANQPKCTPRTEKKDKTKIDEKMKWLDEQAEELVKQQKEIDSLKEELFQREQIIKKKETVLLERGIVEIKQMRSSRALMDSLEFTDEDKRNTLLQGKEYLLKTKQAIVDEENEFETERLFEIDEALDALEAALEYKNEVIEKHQELIRESHVTFSDNILVEKLKGLSSSELQHLLRFQFEKVVKLRQDQSNLQREKNQYLLKIEELEGANKLLENQIDLSDLDTERKLTRLQKETEIELSNLKKHVIKQEIFDQLDKKLHQVSKDLYYYKKLSREYKKKFGELRLAESRNISSPTTENKLLNSSNNTNEYQSVRISKKDLRRMSDEEVKTRKSSITNDENVP